MQKPRAGYIPEIQGLRTIALLMVATFHIWFGKVSGGVDIFLLVSAYLLTRSLVGRSEKSVFTRPFSFLVLKFARLLPAASVAIALILVGAFAIYSGEFWRGSVSDAISSLLYMQNIQLQNSAVDYFNADHSHASPFQHFWSLSVQGQVFVLFALLHLVGDVFARVLRLPVRKVLLALFGIVAVASFVYSVWLTDKDQAFAYFDTGARIWEFAVGSMLALVHPWLRLSSGLRAVTSWIGVLAMLACGFVLPVESSFPGWAALWPVGAAMLVIVSAGDPTNFGADRILAHGILNKLGGYTYALYLTHWPVLVFFLWANDLESANWWQGIIVLSISAGLSVFIARCVEIPFAKWVMRDKPPRARFLPQISWRAPATILLSAALVLSLAGIGNSGYERRVDEAVAAADSLDFGSIGANDVYVEGTDHPLPDPLIVEADWSSMGPDCAENDPYRSGLCYEIEVEEGEAERSIFAIGSSHSTQFSAALVEAVNRHPTWSLRTQVSPACYYRVRVEISEDCALLWDVAAAYVAEEKPDLMVLYGTQTQLDWEMPQPELVDWLQALMEVSPETQFVVLRDNPRNPFSPFRCATQYGFGSERCVYRYETETDPEYVSALAEAGAIWVDLNEFICPDRECRPSRGGVVTYLDGGHLTSTYVRTLAQPFAAAISDAVEWWPEYVYTEGEYVDRAGHHDVLEDLNRQQAAQKGGG